MKRSGQAPDAAQDELALHLALRHRGLVLAGHLGNLLGGKGVDLIGGDDAIGVKIALARKPSMR